MTSKRRQRIHRRSSEAQDDPEVIDLGDGYIGSNGHVFHEDLGKIDPPASEDEEEIPHDQVMARFRDREENP
jgi:hypothetical protein